ncbi:MAG: hypothetical protein AB1798_12630 [Spirochaetota bacterium]
MQEKIDISNMNPEAAREYVVALIATLKQTKAKRLELEKEFKLWDGRVKLAQEKNREDLAIQARAKADAVQSDLTHIQSEEADILRELGIAKEQLTMIKNRPEFTVDADLLLAQFQMILGDEDKSSEKFKELEIDQTFDKLKKSMDS